MREILNRVCRRKTFSSVLPIFLNGKWRIAAPGLETAFYYNKYKARNFDKENPLHYIIYTPHDNDEVHFGTFEAYKAAADTSEKHISLKTNWPQRIKNHCIYLTNDRLHEEETYDIWLRTSAGQLRTFEDFLCFGEKVFGDCVEEIEEDITISDSFSSPYKNEGSYLDTRSASDGSEDKVSKNVIRLLILFHQFSFWLIRRKESEFVVNTFVYRDITL